MKRLGRLLNTQNLYLFAGEQRDPNLGLDYLRARYLDVNSGRFYGRDPFKGILTLPDSLHPYIYTKNNPINLIDPSGKFFGLLAPVSIGEIISFYLPVVLKGANLATTVFLMNGLDDFGRLLYEDGAKMIQRAVKIGEAGDKLILFGEAAIGAINTSRAALQFIRQEPTVINTIRVEREVNIQQLEIILNQAESLIARLTQSSVRVEMNEIKIVTRQLTHTFAEAWKLFWVLFPTFFE
jgi:RHS repeat-associated protein